MEQFSGYEDEWRSHLEWFYTLPLFIELPGLRAVHACWDDENISWLRAKQHYTMSKELLVDSHDKHSKAYNVIEETLKGKEIAIPKEYAWTDKEGHVRTENRIKWWKDHRKSCYGDLLFNCPPEMMEDPITDFKYTVYPADAPPVFFGHYWMTDEPVLQSHNIACLDYSIAKDGLLVAYRFDGEDKLSPDKLVYVE
jgi:hypothetical protein